MFDFSNGIVGSPFNRVIDRLTGTAPPGVKLNQYVLLHALKEAGWKDCGRLKSVDNPSRKHIFALPDIVRGKTKSEIRNLVEQPPVVHNLKVIREAF